MKTVFMAVAVVRRGDQVLLRRMDPAHNPYKEPWALFGGRLDGVGTVNEQMNRELEVRWNMTVAIRQRVGWDEELKQDHDGVVKQFVYLDAVCELVSGEPKPSNLNEMLRWVNADELQNYYLNPPTKVLLKNLGVL